ncbi:MAG: DUF1934 domain-containing protein [Phascolarctobacterium sp.]|nr:DUF1934 domain-containing protein [Phascolarctobacterium sp.]
MDAVKIRIYSLSKDASGEGQSTEQNYTGTMAERAGKYYVMYNEDAQSGLEGTKTTLKWDQNRLIIMRSGTVDHRQEFAKGYKDKSIYRTPYMEIPLMTHTRYLYNYFRKGKWHLEIEYTLYHGEEPYGEMQILIEIEGV